MKNADMPAMPVEWKDYDSMGVQVVRETYEGFTKRETIAMHAMKGLLSNSVMGDPALHGSPSEWVNGLTEAAVEFADTLLAKLEEK